MDIDAKRKVTEIILTLTYDEAVELCEALESGTGAYDIWNDLDEFIKELKRAS